LSDEVWAVVPVKCFADAKSRLMAALGDERAALAERFLKHVLDALDACDQVTGVLVATDGEDVAQVCAARGVEVLRDRGEDGERLGAIVDRALTTLEERGVASAIVLMSDLPRLQTADVAQMLDALEGTAMAIAPDARHAGTNALALRLSARFPTAFGHVDSYPRHLIAARERGIEPAIVTSPSLAFDVDTAADLRAHTGALQT
jgi:2-phospho-L-lactate guanylyltransferase